MSKLREFAGGVVDLATVFVVGCVTAGIGGIVLFNIASTMPDDPIWEEMRCLAGVSFQNDEQCFAKKLNEGLSSMRSQFELQKLRQEELFRQRERDLDATIKKRGKEIAELEGRRQALEDEKSGVLKTRSALEEQLRKLEAIEKASTSFTLFTQKSWKRGLTVSTGISYRSFVKNQEWTSAWCYVHFESNVGVASKIDLGNQTLGGSVVFETPSAATLAAGNFTMADVEEARKLCAFPSAGV